MSSYFSSVFTVEDYANLPELNYIVDEQLENAHCSMSEVVKHLQALKPNKYPGSDYILSHILQVCANELAPSITVLLNKSFSTGPVPDDWKSADISPIHKKGSKHKRENNRQISLTSIVCKIGEKIVHDRVIKFWNDLNILNEHQFAYLRGRSTVAQLLSTLHDCTKSRNNSIPTEVIFLDLAKAFDSVPHERLLLKLNRYSIGGNMLVWFQNFLTHRKQHVVIRGICSKWSPVISGTPQGTILGPIFFLIYINDISGRVKSKIKIFTDDTKIYREIKDPITDTAALQSDLHSLSGWAATWQMTFNAEKCESTRIMHTQDNTSPNYTLGGKSLKSVQSVKDLGVTLSSNLSWNKHVGITTNKANKVLGIIKRTVGTGNISLVRPILEYTAPVWSPYLVKNIHAIEKVQRRASRLALNQGQEEWSYEDRCKLLNWPTLSIRRIYLSLIECYKIVFGLSKNINFKDYFEFSKLSSTRSNHRFKLYVKPARVNCFKYSFFIRIVKPWNSLPTETVEAEDIGVFKRNLRLHLGI